MLLLLTGDIQTGKTRWLERLVCRLRDEDVPCQGVIAPGTWVEHDGTYEKTGIDNILLPEGLRVPFGRRLDLSLSAGMFDEKSQAAHAGLGWAIDDDAIRRVNDHLGALARQSEESDHWQQGNATESSLPGLLVIDELGRLELEKDVGLTHAVELVDRGATPLLPHALVVVRKQLAELAKRRFENAPWNGLARIAPTEESADFIFNLFCK